MWVDILEFGFCGDLEHLDLFCAPICGITQIYGGGWSVLGMVMVFAT